MDSLGIYVSIPFCRAKCTFCNFASQAFPPQRMQAYVQRLIEDIDAARACATQRDMRLPEVADTLFFGGGTPSLLSPAQLRSIMAALRSAFHVEAKAEITLEAAPGQIPDDLLEALLSEGVNRVSLGVQSFVDKESRVVGRLHTGAECLQELERLAVRGILNRNVDLIAGLPFQTASTWQASLDAVVQTDVQHVSVYMLEVDEESKLGREVTSIRAVSQLEVLGQQARYSASHVPSEEQCTELYLQACESLDRNGIAQYEISNFSREGYASRHNRKYWTRAPYLGLGLDAHSMLRARDGDGVLRFAQSDDLDLWLAGEGAGEAERVSGLSAFEEEVFLGLRLVEGIDLTRLRRDYGAGMADALEHRATELEAEGLMSASGQSISLTARGRTLSSSVFGELLATPV